MELASTSTSARSARPVAPTPTAQTQLATTLASAAPVTLEPVWCALTSTNVPLPALATRGQTAPTPTAVFRARAGSRTQGTDRIAPVSVDFLLDVRSPLD